MAADDSFSKGNFSVAALLNCRRTNEHKESAVSSNSGRGTSSATRQRERSSRSRASRLSGFDAGKPNNKSSSRAKPRPKVHIDCFMLKLNKDVLI